MIYIHIMNMPVDQRRSALETLDLNLLRVLDALLAERSVSRAAVRLGRSQPAVSNALKRLRRALGDPLFVRGPDGLTPTTRALALAPPLGRALTLLGDALDEPAPFDPCTARRTFVVAASDHAQLLVVPQLAQRMARWPGLTFRVVPLPRDFPSRELERGELDLVLGIFGVAAGDEMPTGLQRQLLVEERMVAVGRRGHPALAGNLAAAFRLPQLNVSPRGGTATKAELRSRRRVERNIVLYVPHYLVAPWVLASTDLLAVMPERVARRFAETFPLAVVPVRGTPTLRVHQLWHPRAHEDPAQKWLREELKDLSTRAS